MGNEFIINNTKIANEIRKKERDLTGYRNRVIVSSRSGKANYTIESQFVLTRNLSSFEMSVADAAYSLNMQEEKKFTARQLLVTMTGDDNISLPASRKAQIEAIIDKLRATEIYIACEKEAKKNKKAEMLPRYGGRFLDVYRDANGYRFQGDMPMPLHAYAYAKKQMITVPFEYLNYQPEEGKEKECRISNSDENILLKHYLIQQLEIVGNENNSVEEKAFQIEKKKDTQMLSALRISPENYSKESFGNKIRDLRRRTELLLGYWKRIGYLTEYEKTESGFSIHQDMINQKAKRF